MPRRRKTRVTSSNRPTPKVPDGDEGHRLSQQTRNDKVEMMLRDFDREVEKRKMQMIRDGEKMKSTISHLYNMECLNFSKYMDMTIKEFMNLGDALNGKAAEESTDVIESDIMSEFGIDSLLLKPRGGPSQMETISEEGNENQQPSKSSRKVKKGPMKPPPSTAATRHYTRQIPLIVPSSPSILRNMSKLRTPAQGVAHKGGWETPLFTPKFDPRLPTTPATRTVKKGGYKTLFVSEAGSPVVPEQPEICVPVKRRDGTFDVRTISGSDLDRPADMDSNTMQELSYMYEKLHKIFNTNNMHN